MTRKMHDLMDSDFDDLDAQLQQHKVYKLADVADRIERVAFDVVRFKDADNLDKLWVIQERDDGESVIVAMYDDDDIEKKADQTWAALPNKTGSTVNVFYKGEPIVRFAVADLHIECEDASLICRYLPTKLASDMAFRKEFLSDLPVSEQETIFNQHPELKG